MFPKFTSKKKKPASSSPRRGSMAEYKTELIKMKTPISNESRKRLFIDSKV